MHSSTTIIGIDTGGTFTDFVCWDGYAWQVRKVLSTPADPAEAVLHGLSLLSHAESKLIVHGSTVATNAILERKGAPTALITNRGFEDIIEIGRQNRAQLYNLSYRKAPHIVPKQRRFGIPGRIDHTGSVIEEMDAACAEKIVGRICNSDVRSVAVCFLFSFINPVHENLIAELFKDYTIDVSLSHEILSEFREFERTSTTVVNAYVAPKMATYIANLENATGSGDSLRIMQSNGGSISAHASMREPVRTILSGPAGGVIGACELGRISGFNQLISFDMGGTSTDVSLIDDRPSLTLESQIGGYPVKVPMLDIHTVGAGGGSIAQLDPGGSLTVGPESAGACPGPICYGKGEEITVTDANLYLGRIVADYFLGSSMRLYEERLEKYFSRAAHNAKLTPTELAEGILAVANTNMERAIRVISIERGYNPAEFTLLSFGGAGGMHAAFLAHQLGIPRVLVPRHPGMLSALGMVLADIIKDYSVTVMICSDTLDTPSLEKKFASLEDKAYKEIRSEDAGNMQVVAERYLDMRYHGQSHEIIVPFENDYIASFHDLHKKAFGSRYKNKSVDIVTMRLRLRCLPKKPSFDTIPSGSQRIPEGSIIGTREVVFGGSRTKSTVITREKLLHGNRIQGPAVVVEYSSTIVIPPFGSASIDTYGNLIMDIN